MHDYFSHEAKADELDAEGNEQNGKQKCGTVGNALAFNPFHQQHQAEESAGSEENRAHQAKESQRFLGEFGEEEECRDIQQPSKVDARSVHSHPGVVRVLGDRHLLDPKAFAQRQGGDESMQITVQRKRLRD